MPTITAILEPNADGTLHLPLPDHVRDGKIKVTTFLEQQGEPASPSGTPLDALRELRKLNAFEAITDPVSWQRDQRQDRQLPGRE